MSSFFSFCDQTNTDTQTDSDARTDTTETILWLASVAVAAACRVVKLPKLVIYILPFRVRQRALFMITFPASWLDYTT